MAFSGGGFRVFSIIILFLLTVLMAVFAVLNGQIELNIADILSAFNGENPTAQIIIFDIRLPRIIAAIAIGIALGVAGGAYQNMFNNPLISPSILGVLAGASFGEALAMVLKTTLLMQMFLTFIFGFIGVGVAVLKYAADPTDTLPAITYFLMGSLSFASSDTVYFVAKTRAIIIVLATFSSAIMLAGVIGWAISSAAYFVAVLRSKKHG